MVVSQGARAAVPPPATSPVLGGDPAARPRVWLPFHGLTAPGPADYDAVLTEAGDYTAKYFKLRDFFGSLSGARSPLPHCQRGPCLGPPRGVPRPAPSQPGHL